MSDSNAVTAQGYERTAEPSVRGTRLLGALDKKRLRGALYGGAALFALATIGYLVHTQWGKEETDDAQVEGDLVNVSARVPGKVARLLVTDDQIVNAGDVVVELETDQLTQQLDAARADRDAAKATLEAARAQLAVTEKTADANLTQAHGGVALTQGNLAGSRASVEQARASVQSAKSKLDLAALEVERSRTLLARGVVQQDELDTRQNTFNGAKADYDEANAVLLARQAGIASAQGDLRAAGGRLDVAKTAPEQVANARALVQLDEAKLSQAEAALELANLNLSYAQVRAPVRGQVTRRSVQAGHMVTSDVPLFSLVPLEHVWVVANFKEDQLAEMRAGAPATVTLDTYGSRKFHAHVDTFGATSGARLSLLPPENASGNFVKVVQRIPVRIVFDGASDVPLRPGMSADVTVSFR